MRRNQASPAKEKPAPKAIRVSLPDHREFRDLDVKVEGSDGREVARELQNFLLSSMQLQNLLVLAGSGTSFGVGGPSMKDLWSKVVALKGMETVRGLTNYSKGDNIEEFLSRCSAYIELTNDSKVEDFYRLAVEAILAECRDFLDAETRLPDHSTFLRKLSRRRTRDGRLKLFTTNYDLCFERAASGLGLTPIDGFSFGTPRRFDPRFFDYDIVKRSAGSEGHSLVPGVFQYFKLHGSVNWADSDNSLVIEDNVSAENACLIYPARSKFQSSYKQPHLELMARYLSSLREPNTCLVSACFGLQDAHLTAPIISALETNPHFRAIIVSPGCETHLQSNTSPPWPDLRELSQSTDIAFIAADFGQFAQLIPDLKALAPAEDLMRAVRKATAGAHD